jgi:transcriptional regulator with XRE-family HTH domain
MVNSLEFAQRLHQIMDHYGLSATAFSEKLGVNRSTTSHLLSGRNKPSLDVVMKILDSFPEVSLYWLMNGKGEFPHTPAASIQGAGSKANTPTTPGTERSADKISPVASKKLERVILCFSDGSFHTYCPE